MTTGLTAVPTTGDTPGGPSAPVAPEAGAAIAWASLGFTVLARGYRAFLLTLLVVALVPMLWSWSSYVVRSGSMEPALAVGDVVVAQPFSTSEPVPVGRVMVFENPAFPGGHELLVHRVVEYLGHGDYVSAGDANPSVDATPVRAESFRARARILVPYVGLPLVWLRGNDFALLGGWLLLTFAAFVRATRRGPTDEVRERHEGRHAVSFVALVALGGVALGGGLGSGIVPAGAAFTSSTRNQANGWTVAQLVRAYNTAVLADHPYVYYLVDEASGTAAADYSGNSRTGTFASIATYHQTAALPNNPGYSVALGGSTGRLVSGGTALDTPTTFSLELWFRTTTTAGGKLIGFESSRSATGTSYDRHVVMNSSGRLVYGDWTAQQYSTITSPAAYNDGAWHHLVLTATPRGQRQDSIMYVDGTEVTSGVTSRTGDYTGWWRVGYGNLDAGGVVGPRGFAGSIDQPAVYQTELSAARVAAHYAAR